MKLLDHTLTPEGYVIRIWLDELGPDVIREYTRVPYKAPLTFDDGDGGDSMVAWNMSKAQYEKEMLDWAMALARQELKLADPEPVVITENKAAIAEQQEAVAAVIDPPEESDGR